MDGGNVIKTNYSLEKVYLSPFLRSEILSISICDALKIIPIMNLCTSVFVYVGSIGLYKRIVNADGQEFKT